MGRGRYSKWRQAAAEERSHHEESAWRNASEGIDDTWRDGHRRPYRRLRCPACHAWVLEVNRAGLIVAIRDRAAGEMQTRLDGARLGTIRHYEFSCPRCDVDLVWTQRMGQSKRVSVREPQRRDDPTL